MHVVAEYCLGAECNAAGGASDAAGQVKEEGIFGIHIDPALVELCRKLRGGCTVA